MFRDTKQAVLGFEALSLAQRPAELHLSTQDCQEPGVIPRLLDKIPRAAAHGFDGQINARPGRHHDYRKCAIEGSQSREQIKPFLS